MKESTRIMLKNHGRRYDRFVHNYLYFVFYRPYVTFVLYLFRFLAFALSWLKPLNIVLDMALSRYHAKFLSLNDVTKIFQLNENVMATSEENKRIIPFKYAYNIVFKDPQVMAVMDCPCIVAKKGFENLGDCGPINRCFAVGKGLATFWVEHCQKYHARFISQEEALALMQDFRKRGHINQAFFKVATGGRTGVICNCCPDCCVSLEGTTLAKKFNSAHRMNIESGYSVQRDPEKCTNCGTCSKICHFNAISFNDGQRGYYSKWDCMGCGLCTEHCSQGALSLYVDDAKSVPLDIDLVKEQFADR